MKKLVIISKCALNNLSRRHHLHSENLEIQDKNCGCSDCEKRAKKIFNEIGIFTKVNKFFPFEVS